MAVLMKRSTKIAPEALVHFVFHRIRIHRNFNDHVERFGELGARVTLSRDMDVLFNDENQLM